MSWKILSRSDVIRGATVDDDIEWEILRLLDGWGKRILVFTEQCDGIRPPWVSTYQWVAFRPYPIAPNGFSVAWVWDPRYRPCGAGLLY